MTATAAVQAPRMAAADFLTWAAKRADRRYELVRGQPVAMSPETNLHLMVKGAAFRALGDAVASAGLDCVVLPDGATVVIDADTAREPDAAIQCGRELDPDALTLDAPIVVVEVTSPSTVSVDENDKLIEYFSVPSIAHYLVIHPRQAVVVHHSRAGAGEIRTRILRQGEIDLSPPGFTVSVAALLGPAGATRSEQE